MDEKYSRNRVIQLETMLKKLSAVMIDEEYPINGWRMRNARYIRPQSYEYLGDWKSIDLGDKWVVDPEMTVFFSAQLKLPPELRDKNLYLNLKVGGEGLLSINGKPYHGLDKNRI
jgi:alpha-mannosidase